MMKIASIPFLLFCSVILLFAQEPPVLPVPPALSPNSNNIILKSLPLEGKKLEKPVLLNRKLPILPIERKDNILKNISKIIDSIPKIKNLLKPGRVWFFRNDRGEVECKGAVLYDNIAVFAINFDPRSKEVLPIGWIPHKREASFDIDQIKSKMDYIVKELRIVKAVEYREPEKAWALPVVYRDKIVGHIKIASDGSYLIPDYAVNEEMERFGK